MNNNFDYNNYKDMTCNSFINYLLTLSANELTLLAVGIGFLLSANIDANKQNSLGGFFELIGQTLITLAAQNMQLQPNLQQQINYLKQEIEKLKKANS